MKIALDAVAKLKYIKGMVIHISKIFLLVGGLAAISSTHSAYQAEDMAEEAATSPVARGPQPAPLLASLETAMENCQVNPQAATHSPSHTEDTSASDTEEGPWIFFQGPRASGPVATPDTNETSHSPADGSTSEEGRLLPVCTAEAPGPSPGFLAFRRNMFQRTVPDRTSERRPPQQLPIPKITEGQVAIRDFDVNPDIAGYAHIERVPDGAAAISKRPPT